MPLYSLADPRAWDPIWVLSLSALVVSIAMAGFVVSRVSRFGHRLQNGELATLQERLHDVESRNRLLDQDKARLSEDLRTSERERIRLMEIVVSRGGS